jgi:hypothetical protein
MTIILLSQSCFVFLSANEGKEMKRREGDEKGKRR